MADKLKPCPFCGCEVQKLTQTALVMLPQYKGRRGIVCIDCGVIMLANTTDEAIEAWNRRVDNDR